MKKFLSILIPTRNRSRYLAYAVQSALNIPSQDIEILVSENHSSDDSGVVLSKFSDNRLKIYAPDKPLAMHENWEYLLSMAQGEWVYFLGDDDAIMPHAADYLKKVVSRHPRVEAIVSPRAYYFWDGVENDFGGGQLSVSFSNKEIWRDSKKMLRKCIDGELEYLDLPQIYSGGFQRASLINRIKRAQGGIYFKSVTPDAYSALVAVLHTFRYLEIGVPLAWVGTSPSMQSKNKGDMRHAQLKDRDKDFKGMHSDEVLRLNFALGEFEDITFTLCFYEACTSGVPHISYDLVSQGQLKRIFFDFCYKKKKLKDVDSVIRLANELGFSVPNCFAYDYSQFLMRRLFLEFIEKSKRLPSVILRKMGVNNNYTLRSSPGMKFNNILSADSKISEMYNAYIKKYG